MNKKLKVITYNIDGLPEKLDLSTLPWVLKPISWIYKLIKKTTIIKINDNTNTSNKIQHISNYLKLMDADLIAVQEDFNYHAELTMDLHDKYSWGTYSGGFDISKIFSSVECLSNFPFPRFKADGLNLFTKHNTTLLNIFSEDIVNWKKSYGYLDHANDLLTHKGFRFYTITIEDNIDIDVYVLHMDADFYHPQNCPDIKKDIEARKSQFNQLSEYIFNRFENNINNPIIIMGDTNSYNKYEWDLKNISDFQKSINRNMKLFCEEVIPNNYEDCDRIFIINNEKSKYRIETIDCYFDKEMNLSDHKPLIAEFKITNKLNN